MNVKAVFSRTTLIFLARFAVVVVLYAAIGRAVQLPRMSAELTTSLAYALAGADAVSVGALTHSAAAADIALDLQPDE